MSQLQRAETTGEVYRRALFKIQDITKGFDSKPKKIYTDINRSVSYSENNNDLPYLLNTNTYSKRLQRNSDFPLGNFTITVLQSQERNE